MKVKYFRPDKNSIVYEQEEKLYEVSEGEVKETNEYFIHSQFWNGPSPYCPVEEEASSFEELIKKNKNAFEIYVKFNFNTIFDMATFCRNGTLNFEDCKNCSLGVIEEIFEMLKNQTKERD